MGKLEKSFYWLCLVLAIYTTVGFKLIPGVLKEQLVKNLDENLTLKTTIEKVEFNPFTLKTKIYNFNLGEKEKPTLSFELLSVDIAFLRSIFESHVSLQSIKLKGLFTNVVLQEDGVINLTNLVKPKPETKEEPKDESSSDIKFLVSKAIIENANVNFTKLTTNEEPYKLNLKDINYTLYDLGTYNNILSSNNFYLKINENTTIKIAGAFNVQPFKMYGTLDILDLRIKELLDYDKDLFNFTINNEANINLSLNYNIDLSTKTDIRLDSKSFQINNLELIQNKNNIAKLDKLNIGNFKLDLSNQNILLENINLDKLVANMINDKNGINFANLIKQSNNTKKEDTPTQKEESKPWIVNLKDIKVNNSDFNFDDKINNMLILTKNFNTKLTNLNINGSNIDLNNLTLSNPKISFNDKKNQLSINSKNSLINLDNLGIKNGAININNINITKEILDLKDNKSKLNISISKPNINLNSFSIIDSKININSSTIKTSKLNFDDLKSKLNMKTTNTSLKVNKLNIDGSNIDIASINLSNPIFNLVDKTNKMNVDILNTNLDINVLALANSDISIKDIKLSKTDIKFKDTKNNLLLNSDDLQITIDKLAQNKKGLSINSIKVLEPNLDFLNTENKTKILAKNLNVTVSNLTNMNNELTIKKANLVNPNISVILPKAENTKNTTEAQTVKKQEIQKTVKKDEKPSSFKLNIGPLNIQNATLNFEDKNLPVSFKTVVTKLDGKVSEFKNTKSSTTNLEVNGIVNNYGTTKITGKVHPQSIKILTDINMIFKNIAMQDFTPYTSKFIGRELDSGKLNLDLKYNIEQSDLEAKNKIVITKLKLGKNVESADAVSLPLDLAIALIEDRNGVINLDIPLSGNIDDPQFSVAPLIWKAFVNLITKAITAPFSLLGAVFGFEANEIDSVDFDFAQSEITPIQKETLDKVAQILTQKTTLALQLVPAYDEQKDLLALQKEKFEKEVNYKLSDKNDEKEYITLLETMYLRLDKKLQSVKDKNTQDKILVKKSYIDNLENYIISKQKIEKIELENIAKNRVLNIQKYLEKEKTIPTKQIVLGKDIKINTQSKESSNINLEISELK